jgi:hypothetical protein
MAPQRQRVNEIKDSLQGMSLEELQQMSDNLQQLLTVLTIRQVAIEDEIFERLEVAFTK